MSYFNKIHSTELEPGDVFSLARFRDPEKGPFYLTLQFGPDTCYLVCDRDGRPRTHRVYPLPEQMVLRVEEDRRSGVDRRVGLRPGFIGRRRGGLGHMVCHDPDDRRAPNPGRRMATRERRRGRPRML